MSLLDAFGVTSYGPILLWSREEYASQDPNNKHRLRRRNIAERVRFYRDNYEGDAEALVDLVFEHQAVRKQRKKLVKLAMAINPTRRVIDEVANLYDRPAKRIFGKDDMQQRWDEFELETELDEVAQEGHRLTYLCNETLRWFTWSKIDDAPTWRIITPDAFDAIPDPRDPLRPAGFIIDWNPVSLETGADRDRLVHRVLWDDRVFIELDKDWRSIQVVEHGFGRIPGLLLHRRRPVESILDDRSGRDLISAHKAVVLLNLLVIRLAKSQGEQQPVLRGNLARMVTGQAMDGETPLALPPEVFAEMLNTKTDPDHYLKAIQHFIAGVAQTYGMSYEQFTFQEKESGAALMVRREKLTELRHEQRIRATRDEIHTVRLVDDMHTERSMNGFDATDYRTDFAEQLIPMNANDEVDLLDSKMRKGLDNPVAWLQRKNPDLNAKQAAALVKENLTVWGWLVDLSRKLNAKQDDSEGPDRGQSPEDNGAMGTGAQLRRNQEDSDGDTRSLARRVLSEVANAAA